MPKYKTTFGFQHKKPAGKLKKPSFSNNIRKEQNNMERKVRPKHKHTGTILTVLSDCHISCNYRMTQHVE